jgi:hypothetical protein
MRPLLIALLFLPVTLWGQQDHRPATEEEEKILLSDEDASRMQSAAINLTKKAEITRLHQGMLGNAMERGLDDQQIKGYFQRLTDLGLSNKEMLQQATVLANEYFARSQVKDMDKIMSEENRKKHEEKFQYLQKLFDENKITYDELDAAISALDKEISQSPITLENEKKQKELEARFFKTVSENTFVKSPTPASQGAPAITVLVPNDFKLKDYKPHTPLCLDNQTQDQSSQLELYMNGINKELQEAQKPLLHQVYFSWGYNRAWHSKTDVQFTTPDGSFTIHKAHGDDRPSPFDPKIYFNPVTMSIPQYNIDFGVMFNPKWGLEGSMNHMKWVFDNSRPYELSGDYNRTVFIKNPNPQYGWDLSNPVTFSEAKAKRDASFVAAEHSDGYNYASLGMVYKQNLFETKNKNFSIDTRFGAGAGLMIPKTKVIFHQDQLYNYHGLDNKFHIAGGGVHGDVGIKFTLFNSVYLQAITRGSYIKVKDALVDGTESRMEHIQPIGSVQVLGQIGYQHTLKPKTKKKPAGMN